jgi:hypothetical protein
MGNQFCTHLHTHPAEPAFFAHFAECKSLKTFIINEIHGASTPFRTNDLQSTSQRQESAKGKNCANTASEARPSAHLKAASPHSRCIRDIELTPPWSYDGRSAPASKHLVLILRAW